MAEEVRISPDGPYILVSSVGSSSLGEMMQTLSKIAELRRDHSIDKGLVDSRTRSGQPPVPDLYRGDALLAEKLGFGTRIAVLVSQLTADHTLFENVAVIRGAVVAYFQNGRLGTSLAVRRMIVFDTCFLRRRRSGQYCLLLSDHTVNPTRARATSGSP